MLLTIDAALFNTTISDGVKIAGNEFKHQFRCEFIIRRVAYDQIS